MTQAEFKNIIKEKINQSSHGQLVDFSVSICEQLLPDYISFSKAEDYGNITLMKEAITFCKENRDQNAETLEMTLDLEDLEKNIPDVDESEDLDSTTAMNASCAIFELLEYLTDRESDHIVNIAIYRIDTVAFKSGEADSIVSVDDLDSNAAIMEECKRLLAIF